MSLLDFFRSKPAPVSRKSYDYLGVPLAKPQCVSDQTFIKEGLKLCATVQRCVALVSSTAADIPLEVYVDGEKMPEHPLQKLINKPNQMMIGSEFHGYFMMFYTLLGKSYLEAITKGMATDDYNAEPINLFVWPAQNMEILGDRCKRIPTGYRYQNGEVKEQWKIDVLTAESNIMYMKTPDPDAPWAGMSPLTSVGIDVDQFNAANQWNFSMLKNSMKPSGILEFDVEASLEQMSATKKSLEESFTGPQNAGRPQIAGVAGAKFQQISQSQSESDFIEGMRELQRRIASAFSVPSQKVPVAGDSTYSNMQAANLAFYDEAIIPLINKYAILLTDFLGDRYPDSPVIKPNLKGIPALEARRKELMNGLKGVDWITPNEKREESGFERIDDDSMDEIYQGAGLLPIGFDIMDQQSTEKVMSGMVAAFKAGGLDDEMAKQAAIEEFKMRCP